MIEILSTRVFSTDPDGRPIDHRPVADEDALHAEPMAFLGDEPSVESRQGPLASWFIWPAPGGA